VVVAAIAGAAIGAKLLYLLENPALTLQHGNDFAFLMGGKTVVGALLGGTLLVEFVKARMGLRRRTGDLFAVPLAGGIGIGRIGCFLAGKGDDTYGIPTTLPWGIDLGDGIRRHPLQLYEIAAMLLLAFFLNRVKPPRYAEGDRFRLFVFAYYSWRLAFDFLKPGVPFAGLTFIQWACVAGILWYSKDVIRIMRCHSTPLELANG
jgi:phosphatidylglycerol:prolipoprotein diacylglycerol transferase